MHMLISPHCLMDKQMRQTDLDQLIYTYMCLMIMLYLSKKHFGTSSVILTRLQCAFTACSAFPVFATFQWNGKNLKFTSFCVNIFITVLLRVLKIKQILVRLTFWTATSSYQVMGTSLKKVWVMQNIPRWIWSFSCNWLDENKGKWAGHGLIDWIYHTSWKKAYFRNKCDKFKNAGARILDSVYHMTFKLFCYRNLHVLPYISGIVVISNITPPNNIHVQWNFFLPI